MAVRRAQAQDEARAAQMALESSTSPGPDAGPPSPVTSSRPMSPAAGSPKMPYDDRKDVEINDLRNRMRRAASFPHGMKKDETVCGIPAFFPHGPLGGISGSALNLSTETKLARGESRSSSFSSTNSHPLAAAMSVPGPAGSGFRPSYGE